MRTPAGKDCPHYYEDYYRGREVQECRLVKENAESERWQPNDCSKCIVPDILNANASRDLLLKLTIRSTLLGFRRQLVVDASCLKHRIPVVDPFVGCVECNKERPGLDLFRKALEDIDD